MLYQPIATQYLILGFLKSLYPKEFQKALEDSSHREEMFNKVNGTAEIYRIIKDEKYITWKLKDFYRKDRLVFRVSVKSIFCRTISKFGTLSVYLLKKR